MSSVVIKSDWRTWSTFRVALILALSSMIGMAGVLAIVSHGIDAHQAQKEQALVEMHLNRAQEAMGETLIAGSIWDEAVGRMNARDTGWYDRFLGQMYAARTATSRPWATTDRAACSASAATVARPTPATTIQSHAPPGLWSTSCAPRRPNEIGAPTRMRRSG